MPHMLILGRGGSINAERVLAVASLESAPVKKLLRDADDHHVLNLTYGYPRRSLVVFDGGLLAVTSRTVEELTRAVHMGKELDHDNAPWW